MFDPETVTLDTYFAGLRQTFELSLFPRNLALQRLEFEALMLEAVAPDAAVTRTVHASLHARAQYTLIALGLESDDAAVEGQLLLDTFYGIQVGLVVSGDIERATAAFDRWWPPARPMVMPSTSGAAARITRA